MKCTIRPLLIGLIAVFLMFQFSVISEPAEGTSGSITVSPGETKYINLGYCEIDSLLIWSLSIDYLGWSLSYWLEKPDGTHVDIGTFWGEIVDQNGYWDIGFHILPSGIWSATINYYYENLNLDITITSPNNGDCLNCNSIIISGEVSQSFDEVAISTDDVHYELADMYIDTWNKNLELDEGTYTIYAEATIYWGDFWAKYYDAINLVIDISEPVLQIVWPESGMYVDSTYIEVMWDAVDNLSGISEFQYKTDDQLNYMSVGLMSFVLVDLFEEGSHNISVKAIDRAGNEDIICINVFCDITMPSISILTPINESRLSSSSFIVKWDCYDYGSGIDYCEIRIDSDTWINIGNQTEYEIMDLPDGWHTIELKIVDKVGHQATAKTNFDINTDIFSIQGPYNGIPLFAIIIGVIAVALFLMLTILRKRKGQNKVEPPEKKP